MSVHFSSKTDQWATPREFAYTQIGRWGINFDVCADPLNTVAHEYFTKKDNALSKSWAAPGRVCWMNPPYGRGIINWVAHAWATSKLGTPVVCLLPARTDTRWFHGFIWDSSGHIHQTHKCVYHFELIKGRLKFGDGKNSAPFPSMLVVFDHERKLLAKGKL